MESGVSEQILITLRRIMRAVDRHSRALVRRHGLTAPQAIVLRAVTANGSVSIGALARAVNLSQATVTDIVARLEARRIVERRRDESDKRRVLVSPTPAGRELLAGAVPLLQERFVAELHRLEDWEQTWLLASLQRIAAMMNADAVDAAPLLSSEPIDAPAPVSGAFSEPALR
ncbi:MAG: MarR family transcriptional regulator [Gammaproteobacteria bacterium]|nr:MarR family transcriptional regulator [Gammaproteobacteria bacterium]